MKGAEPRRKTVIALTVVASIVLFLGAFAVWASRQALQTDDWVDTSTELLEDKEISNAIAGFMVEALFENVDVESEVQSALPPQAQKLAGPVTGALRNAADRAAVEALERPRVQQAWENANRNAHEQLLALVEDDKAPPDGAVALDLKTLVEDLGARTGVDVADKLPPDAAKIEILKTDQLSAAQNGVKLLKAVAWILSLLALALFALAIYLAKGWRRKAVRMAGIGFIVVGIVVLAARGLAGGAVVSALTSTASVEPAVQNTWSIGTSLLAASAAGLIVYGIVAVLGAWLAGPGRLAKDLRQSVAPLMREPLAAYGVLALILLLIFWCAPTEGTQRLAPAIAIVILSVIGFEALRRQTVRDFPDATWDQASEPWRNRFGHKQS